VSAQADIRMEKIPAATTRVRAIALTAEHVAVLSLACVSVVLVALTWNRWGDLSLDTGYDLVAGAKVSHANAPYLDYQYWYGPLGPLVLGALYELVGIGVWPAVALGLVLAAAGIGLGYVLAARLAGPAAGAVAGALCAVAAFSSSNISWVQPHALGAPLGVLCCLAAVLAVVRFAHVGRRRWLVAAGLATGLSAMTRPECFLAALVALGGWLAIRALRAADRRAALRDAAIVLAGAGAVPLVGYGAFLVVGRFHGDLSLGALIHEDLFPRGLLRESVSTIFADLAPRTPMSFVALAGKAVLYGAGVGATVLLAGMVDRGGRTRAAALLVLGVVAVGLLALLLGRPETVRFYLKYVFGWLPAGAVLATVLLARRALTDRGRPWTPRAQTSLLVALMLVAFSYSAYARFWPIPNPDFAQNTSYAMPFVAAFLVALHVRAIPALTGDRSGALRAIGIGWVALVAVATAGVLVHDARQERFTVHGVDGSMRATLADGPAYQAAIDVIQRETKRSEPILLAPQMTSLYVMTGRRDVLPQLSLLPGALDGAQSERDAIRTMEDSRLRLAIVDRRPVTRYAHGTFGVEYDRRIGAWLRQNFSHISTLRGRSGGSQEPRILDVWLRRTL
jgi:hypothetical protein